MVSSNYRNELHALLVKEFVSAGYQITKQVELDPIPESAKYEALNFSLNEKKFVYRKGNITSDRPGAFLAVWQRPAEGEVNNNKPMPLTHNELDYLMIQVESHPNTSEASERNRRCGMFIFPVALLIEKGIVTSLKNKGKTGFRVFPPWSQDRGTVGTKVFSESGKKTQRWQLPFFLEMGDNDSIDSCQLKALLSAIQNKSIDLNLT